MPRQNTITFISGTRAALDAAASAAGLVKGEPFFIEDEARFGIGLTTSTYQLFAKQGELAAALPETKTLGYAGGNLTAVTSNTGKSITLAYSNGRLTTVTAVFAGKTVTKTLTYLADGQTINKITTVVT